MKCAVILPAAGRGTRLGGDVPKAERVLAGKPLFAWSLETLLARNEVVQVVVAVHPSELDDFSQRQAAFLGDSRVDVIAGSQVERWDTVRLAMEHLADEVDTVLIHDAARPVLPAAMLQRVFDGVRSYGAVVPVLPLVDTVRSVGGDGESPLGEVVDRSKLVRVQTPQAMRRALLEQAIEKRGSASGLTDDAAWLQSVGIAVHAVEGDPRCLKLTVSSDQLLLEHILQSSTR